MAVPTTTSVSPNAGPVAGGTTLHLVGTGYTGTTGATIGGTAATGVTVVDDTHLTIVSPAKSAGSDAIVVTNGTGPSTVNVNFTYVALPVVTSLDVTSGNINGGTIVTITGTGFTGATAVAFGATAAEAFDVINATTIEAVTPVHVAGQIDVTVTTVGGTSATGSGDHFTFAVEAEATYTEPGGTIEGVEYYEDIDISPASLASGALHKRLDPWIYPQRGVIQAAKQGTAGSPNSAAAPANDAAAEAI